MESDAIDEGVYMFLRQGETSWTFKSKYSYEINVGFGTSVALDRNYILVGTVDNQKVSTFEYQNISGVPSFGPGSSIQPSNLPVPNFGFSVALWGDYAIVGAPGTSNTE